MKKPTAVQNLNVEEDRPGGKHLITLMSYLPAEDIKEVWKGMDKGDRAKFFGHGHAEELDNFVKHLGKKNVDHLKEDGEGEGFGSKLHALHSGAGMDDHKAARVLHTASGVRMAHRAAEGPAKIGNEAYQTTMRVLNARYREK